MKRGFTLIELLVVIAIIGILSSIIISSLNNARTKANDAKRKAELRNLQTALSSYFLATNNRPANRNPCCGYPDSSPNFLQELVS